MSNEVGLKLSADEVAESLKKRQLNDIENFSSIILDIGKFLFTVATTSIGILVAITKFTETNWGFSAWASVVCFSASSVVALFIIMPLPVNIGKNTDVQKIYNNMVILSAILLVLWLVSWMLGIFIAISLLFA